MKIDWWVLSNILYFCKIWKSKFYQWFIKIKKIIFIDAVKKYKLMSGVWRIRPWIKNVLKICYEISKLGMAQSFDNQVQNWKDVGTIPDHSWPEWVLSLLYKYSGPLIWFVKKNKFVSKINK